MVGHQQPVTDVEGLAREQVGVAGVVHQPANRYSMRYAWPSAYWGSLPLEGGEVTAVEVWGGDAQVRLSGDTVFLSRTQEGWKVVAAACTPQSEGPYDCEVQGA